MERDPGTATAHWRRRAAVSGHRSRVASCCVGSAGCASARASGRLVSAQAERGATLTEPEQHLCVIGNKPHPAEVGNLCRGHYGRLSDTIRDIETQTLELSAVPSMAVVSGRGGSLASHRSPARIDVLTLTDRRRNAAGLGADWDHTRYDDTPEVLDTLGSWARMVREERGFTMTGHATVVSESETLTRNLDWLAEQQWVDEMFDDLRKLLTILKRVNGDPDDKPAGRCYLPQADGVCGGAIWIDSVAAHAACGRCGETWDGRQIANLNWEMERAKRPTASDGTVMETLDELARKHNCDRATMRRRLNRNGARSLAGYFDPAAAVEKVSA